MFIFFFLTFNFLIIAQPSNEGENITTFQVPMTYTEGDTVTIEGIVRRVGSDPFFDFVITDANETDWYVAQDSILIFGRLEQQSVKVNGLLSLRRMILANGRELTIRYELSKIKLIQSINTNNNSKTFGKD